MSPTMVEVARTPDGVDGEGSRTPNDAVASRVAISLLSVEGYRSIRTAWVRLGTVNVVLGPNGSGKTNLYRSLALLVEAADGSHARAGRLGDDLAAAIQTIGEVGDERALDEVVADA